MKQKTLNSIAHSTSRKMMMALLLLLTMKSNSLLAQCTTPLGSSSNSFSTLYNRPNQLIVNNDLNSVIFIHRQNNTLFGGDNGVYQYDISTDNGATWQINQGALNPGSTLGQNGGRFPQVGIYNPDGNSDVAEASLVYLGSTTEGFLWNGYVTGSVKLDGLSEATENYNQAGVSNTQIAGGFCQGAPGEFWSVDALTVDGFNIEGIRVLKGTYSAGDVNWAVNTEFYPDFNTDLYGFVSISDWNIAFDPTGQIGWVVLLTHLNGSDNYIYHPVFYYTTDGGETWSDADQLEPSDFSSITSLHAQPALGNEIDLTVDVNGDPHALVGVFNANNYPYSLNYYSSGHMFEFTNDGASWIANAISPCSPNSSYMFGVGTGNRPQVSRSDDGEKIIFTWVDSDIPMSAGNAPNLKAVTYDVPTGARGCVNNYALKCPSDFNGQMSLTTISPNLLEEGGSYTLPVVIGIGTDMYNGGLPMNYHYMSGLQFSDSDFTTIVTPVYPTIEVAGTIPFCFGESVELTASSASSYLWSTGETTQTITAYGGNYWVINPEDNYCIGEDNFVSAVSIYSPEPYVNAMSGALCPGSSVDLIAFYYSSGNEIVWSNGQTGDYITVTEPGSYFVTVDGCTSQFAAEVYEAETPLNDHICDAQVLTMNQTFYFDNTCATADAGEPVPPMIDYGLNGSQDGWYDDSFMGAPVLNNTVWFSFLAPSTGAVNIFVEGNDTQIALYSSSDYTCNGQLTLISANDDGDFYLNSKIDRAYCLKKNKRYFIQVDGSYGSSGPLSITVTPVANTVVVCQQLPNGNTVTLSISGCALQAHLANGGSIGPCIQTRMSAADEEEVTAQTLLVYPNPTHDEINVSFESDMDALCQMQLINMTGQMVLSNTYTATEGTNYHTMDLQQIPSGVYFLIIQKGDNIMQTRFIKE